MSYFDSRVYGCPVWQVVGMMVMKARLKVEITMFVADAKHADIVLRVELTIVILGFIRIA